MYHGKRVLLIDNDPQTNLTFLCASLADWKKHLEVRGSLETLYRGYIDNQPLSV